MEITDLTQDEFQTIWNAAIDWQFLTVKSGRMARKSDLDAWLMQRFGLSLCAAHTVANFVESKSYFVGARWIGPRPEPEVMP